MQVKDLTNADPWIPSPRPESVAPPTADFLKLLKELMIERFATKLLREDVCTAADLSRLSASDLDLLGFTVGALALPVCCAARGPTQTLGLS